MTFILFTVPVFPEQKKQSKLQTDQPRQPNKRKKTVKARIGA